MTTEIFKIQEWHHIKWQSKEVVPPLKQAEISKYWQNQLLFWTLESNQKFITNRTLINEKKRQPNSVRGYYGIFACLTTILSPSTGITVVMRMRAHIPGGACFCLGLNIGLSWICRLSESRKWGLKQSHKCPALSLKECPNL